MSEPTPHPGDSLLNEYLDGELSEGEVRRLESHLDACADCGARLDALRQLFSRLSRLPDETPTRDLAPLVRARVRQRQRQPLLALAILAQAAAAALAISLSSLPAGWPALLQSITPYIPAISDPRPGLQGLNQSAQSWLNGLQTGWASFSISQSLPIPLPQTSAMELGVLLFTATLLWLAGNGWLIASIKNNPPRRTL